ncbi:velvet factor [Globomyces pollinis-pini]|nr:velvet factor [Globomyces pollinis-pini]
MIESELEPTFKYIVRQEPDRGRICGLKHVVNRRLLDPPLVFELQPVNETNPCDSVICHLTIFSADRKNNLSVLVKKDGMVLETMVGDNVVNCDWFTDPVDHLSKLFIVIPNISVRIVGQFCLQYHLVDLKSGYTVRGFTKPFEIYSNKIFPGNLETTQLTTSFIKQGIRIRTKEPSVKDPQNE